jgi:hypothetical protein
MYLQEIQSCNRPLYVLYSNQVIKMDKTARFFKNFFIILAIVILVYGPAPFIIIYDSVVQPMYYRHESERSTVSVILDYFIHDIEDISVKHYAHKLANKTNSNINALYKVITTLFSYYLIIVTVILIGLGIYLRKKNDKETSSKCFISSTILILGTIVYFIIINYN